MLINSEVTHGAGKSGKIFQPWSRTAPSLRFSLSVLQPGRPAGPTTVTRPQLPSTASGDIQFYRAQQREATR